MIIKPGDATVDAPSSLAVLHLDRQFGTAADWAVLHDLRVPAGAQLLQLDHLLINDFLECVCIDSRYLTRRLSHGLDGRLALGSPGGAMRIGSPLDRAARQARLLAPLVERRRSLRQHVRQRLRMGPRVSVQALVLHDAALSCDRRRDPLPGAASLVGTEALHLLLQRQRRRRPRRAFERVPATVLREMALTLAHRHRPIDGEPAPTLPTLRARSSVAF